jgi:hypothetical protein
MTPQESDRSARTMLGLNRDRLAESAIWATATVVIGTLSVADLDRLDLRMAVVLGCLLVLCTLGTYASHALTSDRLRDDQVIEGVRRWLGKGGAG